MRQNNKKISYEDSIDRLLVFSPKTQAEARSLLDKLINKGFKRDDSAGQGPLTLNSMCEKGVGVYNGRFFCAPDDNARPFQQNVRTSGPHRKTSG